MNEWEIMARNVPQMPPFRWLGRVNKVIGMVVESLGPQVSVGELCRIHGAERDESILAETVGFRDDRTLLMPLGDMHGICHGDIVIPHQRPLSVKVGQELLGRALDGLGRPIDNAGPLLANGERSIHAAPLQPLERRRISEPLVTGMRVMDCLLTCGKGQRMGIFSGSGVGKSVFLGEIARNTSADVNVIALVGERGREVRNFIEDNLQEALKHSVVIAATSDQPALVRVKAAFLAMTVAEYFRDLGHDVLLMMDSVTRFANAQREIGLAVGEPPATRGYTPSVFALLPRLLERCGINQTGSITGLFTVLVDGDDMNEPVADCVRSILDGHVVLSRKIASRGHYPAVDIHESVSRVMRDVASPAHVEAARRLKAIANTHREAEDMINIGAYRKGASQAIDHAIAMIGPINKFLRQDVGEHGNMEQDVARLMEIAHAPHAAPAAAPVAVASHKGG